MRKRVIRSDWIGKQTHSTANYAILNTYASPGTLKEAHKLLQHDADVVRFMTIRLSR